MTIPKIIEEYAHLLGDYTIKGLKTLKNPTADELRFVLFSEEGDFYYDSGVDYNIRKKGVNPMCDEYIKRVAAKREAFGVTPLNAAGYSIDESSKTFCEKICK